MVRQLDPTNEHALNNHALYSFQKELWEDAIQAFSKIIVLNPENANAYMYRGRAQASVTRYDQALEVNPMSIHIHGMHSNDGIMLKIGSLDCNQDFSK